MAGSHYRNILALLALSLLLSFGCTEQLQKYLGGSNVTSAPEGEDAFGQSLEAISVRISTAGDASKIASLNSELATLGATAGSNQKYAPYLPLIEAQNLTLQVLATYMEFRSEGAKLGSSGIDCAADYAAFIARLRAANATAASATSKANAWQSSHANSTAKLLVSTINRSSPATMAAYAELLEMQLARDCPPVRAPGAQYALPLSFQDALSIASGVAGDRYFVYGMDSPLPAGTNVSSPEGAEFALKKDTWLFFLDSNPWMPFGHDVKYVMIDAASAAYRVANGTMYPLIDGMPYWSSSDQRTNPDEVLYPEGVMGSVNLSAQSPRTRMLHYALAGPDLNTLNAGKGADDLLCCQDRKKYALIMIGSPDPMFEYDGKWMYEYLRSIGYPPETIYYIDALGTMPNADGRTTIASFEAGLIWLNRNVKCCDEVFIFLAAHGYQSLKQEYKNKATGERKLVGAVAELANPADWEFQGQSLHHGIEVNPSVAGGGRVNSATFIGAYLRELKSCKTTVMYFSCFSGAAAGDLKLPGVELITPVDANNPAYGQNADGEGWKAGSFFTQSFINAKGPANGTADLNHDGTVTDREAYNYANAKTQEELTFRWVNYRDLAEGEANATKKAMYEKLRDSIVDQKDGICQEGPACTCCYVNCTEATGWKCSVFEGRNKPNCDECKGKKIGDMCKAVTVIPPPANETPLQPPNETQNRSRPEANQTPPRENATAVCGDGKVTGSEGCDYGNTSTNKCDAGYYCHESCVCKKLETSVVCGDGKISSPNEDCDGGNVKFKSCPPGQECRICKCVGEQAQCGDGRVTPPEECDHGNTYTSECPGGNTCYSCRCVPYGQVPQETHRECAHEACTEVSGAGEDECTSDEQCEEGPDCGDGVVEGNEQCEDDNDCADDEYCSGCTCIERPAVCGDGAISGSEECEEDGDCRSGYVCSSCRCVQKPAQCGDGAINGNEQCDPRASPSGCGEPSVCGSNCRCVSPPTLNCDQICGYTPGAQSFRFSGQTTSECGNAVKSYYGTRTCYLTCAYAYLYKVTNIAGSAYCCCGMKKEFQCSDCPGQNPQCPSQSTCDQNAPSWYSYQ